MSNRVVRELNGFTIPEYFDDKEIIKEIRKIARLNVSSLETRVTTNEGNITTLQGQVNNLQLQNNVGSVSTIAQLAALSTTSYDTATVDNVGTYKPSQASLTADGYKTVTATGGGFWVLQNASISTPKISKELVLITEVLPGVIADTIESVTKNGATSTATYAKTGAFDKITVTGGDQTSWIQFPNISSQDNMGSLRAKILVNTVGATSPLLGIGFKSVKQAHETSSAYYSQCYVNLLTKALKHQQGSVAQDNPTVTKTSAGTLCSNGDILELHMSYIESSNQVYFRVMNTKNGEFAEGLWTVISRSSSFDHRMLTMNLTDGAYTILSYRAYSSVGVEPLIGITGDSYACGDNINWNQNWPYLVKQALPGREVICFAGNGTYVTGMAIFHLRDILKLRPKYVIFFSALTVYYGYHDDGDANQTEFDTSFNRMLDAVTGYGGIPVLVKWQTHGGFIDSGPAGAGASAAWNAKVATLQGTYPTIQILDISNENLQLNNVSHLTTGDAIKVAKKVADLMVSNGAV